MKSFIKILGTTVGVVLVALFVMGWAPDVTNFVSTQFGNDGATVYVKDGALFTNATDYTFLTVNNLQSVTGTNLVVSVTNATSSLFAIRDDGKATMGRGTPSSWVEFFEVQHTYSGQDMDIFNVRSTYTLDLTNNSHHYAAVLAQSIIPASNSSTYTNQVVGSYNYVQHNGSGLLGDGIGTWSIIEANGASLWTLASSFKDSPSINGTSYIPEFYHYYAKPVIKTSSGNVSNIYGIYLGNDTAGTNKNYGVYQVGASVQNHWEGPHDFNKNFVANGSAAFQADGTAALPAFAAAGSASQGMYRVSNGTVGWSTAGVNRMSLTAGLLSVATGTTLAVTNGIASYASDHSMTTVSTGCTNATGFTQIVYVTAATSAALTDAAGTTEFSGVTIAAFTPIRIQNGGKFTGTAITYATGTSSHAW